MVYVEIDAMGEEFFPSESESLLIKKAVERVLELEAFPYDTLVSVLLVSREEIQDINREQRGKDKPTDVLSFPGLNFDEQYQLIGEIGPEDYDPEFQAVYLGDIVICADVVAEQAIEYGHSREREMLYLTIHSMYHLLGYDHEIPELKRDMRAKEEAALGYFSKEGYEL